ncbi:hypothetical protein IQ274_28625 [Nostoc sp. LEGE 12447]|uniref:hypothetical protein n=1 Tax=Nostoc sp. LEGE 12447 TaxID=1828640 RepID=UPI001883C98A|nr:hypothetical protein [Nostoc sp. LEGE 12447]MBE9002062.1 hypothetical protein [Nostoc sp. LEGE 12447]
MMDYALLEQCLRRAVWCRFIYPQVYRFTLISTPSPATMFCWLPSLKIIGSPLLPSVTTVVALGQNCDS